MKVRSVSRKKILAFGFGMVLLFSLICRTAIAQKSDSASNQWHFLAEPYLELVNMKGSTDIGNLPELHVFVPFSDLFSHLKIAGMLYLEAHNNRFAIATDIFFSHLQEKGTGPKGLVNGQVDMKLLLWELDGYYRINPWLEFGLGARLNSLQMDLSATVDSLFNGGPYSKSLSFTKTWVDPVIITRMKKELNDKWIFTLRADIGGFGIGSQLTWQVEPDIYYKFSKLFQLGLGYRYLSTDYSSGSGSDYFLYDIALYGPEIRLGFHF